MLQQMTPKKQKMCEALSKCFCNVTIASKNTGIERNTHYTWMKEDEEYRLKVEDLKNISLDIAEAQIMKNIKTGCTTSLLFFLKCQGKKRGWIEKPQDEKPQDNTLTIKIEHD